MTHVAIVPKGNAPHRRGLAGTGVQLMAVLGLAALGLMAAGGQASAAPNSSGAQRPMQVEMRDSCDPATFNAGLRPGACVGDGNVTFQRFNDDLTLAGGRGQLPLSGGAGAWKNNPSDTHINAGQTVVAINVGGEGHSFAEVASYGGGCVASIDATLHLTPVAECSNPAWRSTIAASGASVGTAPLAVGTHRFECLIHPWMRTTITVR
jgi:plastocyanin